MGRCRVVAVFALVLGMLSPAVHAADCIPAMRDGWVRIPPAGLPMAAGYGTLENHCDAAATIVSASSTAFEETTVHATRVENGISRMRAVPELEVAAHDTVRFAPGGLHLMLMRPTRPLAAGDTIEVEFTLSDGRTMRARFTARGM